MRQFGFILLAALPVIAPAETTFTRDVAPIFYKHCVSCHHANDIAPMPLLTYNDARPWAAAIKEAVITRKMPPWKADPHIGKWSNDWSLSAEEIATIRNWVDGGKPEGDPKALPPAPKVEVGWKAGKPDAVVSIPQQKLEGSGPDQYVYITVPSNFTEDKWVVSAELRPGNRKVVHHAHVFVTDPETKPKSAAPAKTPDPAEAYAKSLVIHEGTLEWVRPDAQVVNDGCAVDDNGLLPGHKSHDLGNLVASYLPGREPDVYPAGTARLIKAGSNLSFQIHYSHTTGKPEFDETSVGFIFAKEPPAKIAKRIDLSNQMFRIPAGAPEQEVSECHTFDKDIYITSLTPHMHLRGKAMQMIVTYPDGRRETLLSVPHYDFNWQITYRTAKPIFIPKGTRIAVMGHFDNSPNNPLNPDPTKAVRWGAASETEMMDGWIEYVDADPPRDNTRASSK
ncbi:MAG TPA: hypothetical protein VHB50_06050 [Bryobacteraceae bacterium]|nr:hypothetical protein [Bryobacteraceae bacterium]